MIPGLKLYVFSRNLNVEYNKIGKERIGGTRQGRIGLVRTLLQIDRNGYYSKGQDSI